MLSWFFLENRLCDQVDIHNCSDQLKGLIMTRVERARIVEKMDISFS